MKSRISKINCSIAHTGLSISLMTILFIIGFFINTLSAQSTLKISFNNIANGKPLFLNDSTYTTPFGEAYTIKKLKYYISNIQLAGNKRLNDQDNYQLIDAAGNTSFSIPVRPGNYSELNFMLGIDSLRNCSGAQTGALDPMNDMFWTWNTGYVTFKLEGTSPASLSDLQRIEHHIGGYRFHNNVSTKITLPFKTIYIKPGEIKEIFIEMNLDKYWKSKSEILISKDPVCTIPGALAKKIAENFDSLFSIIDPLQ